MLEDYIAIRERVRSDDPFIFKSWIGTHIHGRLGRILSRAIGRSGHDFVQEKIVRHLLEHPERKILVACSKDDPDTVLGWICYKLPDTVDYVAVKPQFQGEGIAKRLFEATGINRDTMYVTHTTEKFMPRYEFKRVR